MKISKQPNWIVVSIVVTIILAGGLILIIQPKSFEIQLDDGSVVVKYNDGVFKLYNGRYKVLENYYSIECYDGGYKKVYKARGNKYENLTYYKDDDNHYISQVIHYSKGDMTRIFVISDSEIKESLSWASHNPYTKCRVRLKYSGMDKDLGELIYSKNKKIYGLYTLLEFNYVLDWSNDVEKISMVKRYNNGRLDILTSPFVGDFDYDPKVIIKRVYNDFKIKGNIVINQPVKWGKVIELKGERDLDIEYPREARNIKVYEYYDEIIQEYYCNDKEEMHKDIKDCKDAVYFNVTREIKEEKGFENNVQNRIINIRNIRKESRRIRIEYETDPPYSNEIDYGESKIVNISSDIEGYTNILAYTDFKGIYGCNDAYVRWINEDERINFNCMVTETGTHIEWNVPHLSTQDYYVYIGSPYSTQNITNAGVYVNNETTINYNDYLSFYIGDYMYCNNLTTGIPVLSYDWYKNDVSLSTNSSSLDTTGYLEGDRIFCQINGINSTNRHILDTSYDDFSEGTFNNINQTDTTGILKLNRVSSQYSLKGNFTSKIFDLGASPNMSTISWGKIVPHKTYYYEKDLIFGWAGNDSNDYIGGLSGTVENGLIVGGEESTFFDNNATNFPGGTKRITFGDVNDLDMADGESFTISVWFKAGNNPLSGQQIIGKTNAYESLKGYSVAMDSNRFSLDVEDADGDAIISRSPAITLDRWYFGVAVWNGTSKTTSVYLDGKLKDSDTNTDIGSLDNSYALKIGKADLRVSYNGTSDEIHIWKRAFSIEEISELYNFSKEEHAILFQTRTGNDKTDTTNWGGWVNSTGNDGYYMNSTGELINYTYNGSNRYIQYRALFETLNVNSTPILTDTIMKQTDFQVKLSSEISPELNVTWDIWNGTKWDNFSEYWLIPTCLIEEQNCTEIVVENMVNNKSDIIRENETFTPIFKFTNHGSVNITNITLKLNSTTDNIVVRFSDIWNTSTTINISSVYTQININNSVIRPQQTMYGWLYFDYYRPLNYTWDWPDFLINYTN